MNITIVKVEGLDKVQEESDLNIMLLTKVYEHEKILIVTFAKLIFFIF